MLFNSFGFVLLFLPPTLIGFFVIGRFDRRMAAAYLACASLVFYGYWDPRYVALLLISVALNFLVSQKIIGSTRSKRAWLILGVSVNLLILGYFKYADFFIRSFDASFGIHTALLGIVLPIGISFFTFTQIAFLVDVSQGKVERYSFAHYLLFVTYFPHLIAGPILHHSEMMPQFAERSTYEARSENFIGGTMQFTIGLFKKVILADTFAIVVNPVYARVGQHHSVDIATAWLAALSYALQIYFDFSGYTDMALGISRLFGIKLPPNFDSPYKATSIVDFWRRWHMTLSRFLRDYLYIPMGGSRRGTFRRYSNLIVTMLLGGLWHGASWTFVAWGGLHGAYLVINHLSRTAAERFKIWRGPGKAVGGALTFLAVVVAWVVFRSPSFADAQQMLSSMVNIASLPNGFSVWGTSLSIDYGISEASPRVVLMILGGLLICFCAPNSQIITKAAMLWRDGKMWRALGAMTGAVALLLVINASRGISEFCTPSEPMRQNWGFS